MSKDAWFTACYDTAFVFLFSPYSGTFGSFDGHKLFKYDAGDPKRVPSGCDQSLTHTIQGEGSSID